MDQTASTSRGEPLRSVDQLVEHFREQARAVDAFRVGIENEKFGIRQSTRKPLPFDGPGGIEQILQRLHERFGYEPVLEAGRLIGLTRGKVKISLEPGGQLEFAGAPLRTMPEIAAELATHHAELAEVSRGLDCVWLALGEQPFSPLDEIPWMPKQRYRIMRDYMPRRGSRGHYMMKATCTVQANYDFRDEEDACRKLRVATGISPIVTALLSNSSITPEASAAAAAGVRVPPPVDRRYLEWLDTDPDRCGLLSFVFEPDFSFRHYVEWLLDVPMYLLIRDGQIEDRSGESFRRLMQRGEVDLEDFKVHMTTAFPEVRLKSYIEVRGADAAPLPYLLALPALWKGILYDDRALEDAWKLVADLTFDERKQLALDVGRDGLEAKLRGQPLLEPAAELVEIARAGLLRQSGVAAGEDAYLDPLQERVSAGRSLGRECWDLWSGEWNMDPESLIAWARLV
jgi:glutamate--cysteine ligase